MCVRKTSHDSWSLKIARGAFTFSQNAFQTFPNMSFPNIQNIFVQICWVRKKCCSMSLSVFWGARPYFASDTPMISSVRPLGLHFRSYFVTRISVCEIFLHAKFCPRAPRELLLSRQLLRCRVTVPALGENKTRKTKNDFRPKLVRKKGSSGS